MTTLLAFFLTLTDLSQSLSCPFLPTSPLRTGYTQKCSPNYCICNCLINSLHTIIKNPQPASSLHTKNKLAPICPLKKASGLSEIFILNMTLKLHTNNIMITSTRPLQDLPMMGHISEPRRHKGQINVTLSPRKPSCSHASI